MTIEEYLAKPIVTEHDLFKLSEEQANEIANGVPKKRSAYVSHETRAKQSMARIIAAARKRKEKRLANK